ncbi:MAG: SMC-Scp complex subunit ScpB, partial [Thioalkalispiraceae bacterium]
MASSKPMNLDQMQSVFPEDAVPDKKLLRKALKLLGEDYDKNKSSVELKEVSSGFRFQVRKDFSEWISKLWEEKPARYSRALLETLALVAYKQPITRGEIEKIRGVSVSTQIMKTLLEREWVTIVGHRDVPGKPAIYASTKQFLDYFNLKSLDELPPLSEIKDI